MQTRTKYDPPRNRHSYSHDITCKHLYGRKPKWDALNRAEYYIWRAIRSHYVYAPINDRCEYEATKAKARFWLRQAAGL